MAAKKTKKAADLAITVIPAQPRANYQFTIEAGGLEPGERASLTLVRPGGASQEASVKAGPAGTVQWIASTQVEGPHTIRAQAGDKSGSLGIAVTL